VNPSISIPSHKATSSSGSNSVKEEEDDSDSDELDSGREAVRQHNKQNSAPAALTPLATPTRLHSSPTRDTTHDRTTTTTTNPSASSPSSAPNHRRHGASASVSSTSSAGGGHIAGLDMFVPIVTPPTKPDPLAHLYFPSIEEVLPLLHDHAASRAVWQAYRDHCAELIANVKALRIDQFELTIRTFWDSFDAAARLVIQSPP
jgi:hypothetical protein